MNIVLNRISSLEMSAEYVGLPIALKLKLKANMLPTQRGWWFGYLEKVISPQKPRKGDLPTKANRQVSWPLL